MHMTKGPWAFAPFYPFYHVQPLIIYFVSDIFQTLLYIVLPFFRVHSFFLNLNAPVKDLEKDVSNKRQYFKVVKDTSRFPN